MSACVVFFGGYQATQSNMDAWLTSAKGQRPNVEFTAFRWPHGASSGANSAVTTFTKSGQYKSVVAAIQASQADKIYIVGHSSGCAIANAVDKGLKDTSKVVLVALDGFTPAPDQLQRSTTQVWGAVCDGVKSMNYPGVAGGRRRVYEAKDCKTKWALHFSLVNESATDSLVKSIAAGYVHCRANLAWL
jgi:pimeloyl-ACP methyl ester carboxylesterase